MNGSLRTIPATPFLTGFAKDLESSTLSCSYLTQNLDCQFLALGLWRDRKFIGEFKTDSTLLQFSKQVDNTACVVSPLFSHSHEEFEVCPSMGLEEPCHALTSHPDHLIRELSARFQALLLISPKLLRCSGEKGNFISVSKLVEVLL